MGIRLVLRISGIDVIPNIEKMTHTSCYPLLEINTNGTARLLLSLSVDGWFPQIMHLQNQDSIFCRI
jgi:hypothetical protein